MPRPEDLEELTPSRLFLRDETTLYCLRDGKIRYRDAYPIAGAHADSFRFYRGSFAKDRKNCYCANGRLAGGNGPTFRALNFAYATDGRFVWTIGGKVKDADAATFEVCDDGSFELATGDRVPHGFAKDAARVYYYDFDGKPNAVRKATPASFESLNDGHFARDEAFVFCGAATLPKADPATWRKLGGFYSRDAKRVFYFNRAIAGADVDSFEYVPGRFLQFARDAKRFYRNDDVLEADQWQRMLEEDLAS